MPSQSKQETAKKATEREWIALLERVAPSLNVRDVQAGPEPPDFHANAGGRRVGIEVTRFSPQRADGRAIAEEQASLRQAVVDRAWTCYRLLRGLPRHVTVTFHAYPALTKQRVRSLAEALAHYLAHTESVLTSMPCGSVLTHDPAAPLAEVADIQAMRVGTLEESAWMVANWGWPYHVQEHDLVPIVGKKESKVPRYRRQHGYDAVWLVIGFERLLGTGPYAVELPIEPVAFTLRTPFDRVLCVSTLDQRYVEIPRVVGSDAAG